ncbi:AraC family transcriptional regulator [Paenibacillus sp. IB182496]|uniref:AraC family transcriptional regulator n=1 Tax=Paenibacillus sabuli TaxID=2772509 RepID=A0A927BYG2_9BACL|nr:AraC family transcriptional regulator [Paenibacillus sabuli]
MPSAPTPCTAWRSNCSNRFTDSGYSRPWSARLRAVSGDLRHLADGLCHYDQTAYGGERILYEDIGLEEAAYACGFRTYTHFSRLFKARFGMTPQDFRRSNEL